MSLLTVTNITKTHGTNFELHNISFEQQPLQNIAIAGETGSGKTTLMQIIGGMGQADSGEVLFEGKPVKGITQKLMPHHPGIGYLSQHFELPKKYRVEELLAYAGKLSPAAAARLPQILRIDHLLQRYSHTLSGGEQQRVALARLLTEAPRLLLLDEPYSNMDLIHKQLLKTVIDDVRYHLGITCMLISHDAEDILPWAHEILVMQHGSIIERGTPAQIYRNPLHPYTAGLFGRYNTLTLALGWQLLTNRPYLRPEDLAITTANAHASVAATIQKINYMGSHYELQLITHDNSILTVTAHPGERQVGDVVGVALKEHSTE